MKELAPILLAEDDENDIVLMRRALREAGLFNPLVVVRDGQEAIWYLNGEKTYIDRKKHPWPCLLLLDLRMPLVNGFEVLAWLQRRRRPKDLIVVILSSSNQEADILRASQLGADAYCIKPQGFQELVVILRELQERIQQAPQFTPWFPVPTPANPERGWAEY